MKTVNQWTIGVGVIWIIIAAIALYVVLNDQSLTRTPVLSSTLVGMALITAFSGFSTSRMLRNTVMVLWSFVGAMSLIVLAAKPELWELLLANLFMASLTIGIFFLTEEK